jgi:Na+-driven multidrug efflux pump
MKRISLAIGLFVFAGTDALQQCTPAAPVYRRALTQRRPVLLKLSATVLDTSEAAVPAAASYPPVPAYRECLVFALNAVGIYAAPTLMSLIDAAFVGRVSTTQLAALGPASSISDSAPFFLLFVSIAATNLVAKAHATKDQAGTARVARTSVAFAGAGGLVLAAVTMLSATTLSRFYCGGNAAVLAPLCARYVGIRLIGLLAVVVASVAQAVLVGMKDTKTPMLALAVAVAACLNLGGDFLLVSRMGLGLAGAAWATVASQVCAAALLLRVLGQRKLLDAPKPSRRADAGGASGASAAPADTRATIVAIYSFASFIFVTVWPSRW